MSNLYRESDVSNERDAPIFAVQERFLPRWLSSLVAPHSKIKDRIQQYQLRVLATFLLLAVISSAITMAIIPIVGWSRTGLLITGLAILVNFALYKRSRSPDPTGVAEATVVLSTLLAVIPIVVLPGDNNWLIPLLLVPILLSTILLDRFDTWFIYLGCLLFVFLLAVRDPAGQPASFWTSAFLYTCLGLIVTLQTWFQHVFEQFRSEQLKNSETRYRTLLLGAYDGVFWVSQDRIISIDDNLAAVFGYTPAALLELDIFQLFPEIELSQSLTINDGCVITAGGQPAYFEFVTMPDVSIDAPTHVIAVRDISQRLQSEEALAQAQRLESLGVLAGGIAHDFNNLLTGIKGQATIARLKMRPEDSAMRHIVKLLASTERAADLTRQLLAYAGKGKYETRVIDFNDFATDILKLLQSNVPTNVDLRTDLVNRSLPVMADPGQLQQVLLNLVINGAQAIGDEDGEVLVRTKVFSFPRSSKTLPVMWDRSQLPVGDYIACTVQDNGAGMSFDVMQRIFDPFFTTKPNGTGLGLAATLGAIKTHHGNLQLMSEPSVGTSFVVWLPLADEDVIERVSEADGVDIPSLEGLTVLVIDDDCGARESITEMLAFAGCRMYAADCGRAGIAKFFDHREEIDLVVLDMQMPDLNGEETYYQLQAIDDAIRVLFCSGFTDPSGISRLAKGQEIAFLAKPFDQSALLSAVSRAL